MNLRNLLFLVCLFPNLLFAEAVGDKEGLLQRFSHEQVEKRVHDHLIKQIKVNNILPYTANETHFHWTCTTRKSHKHVGARNHKHSLGKCNYRNGVRHSAPMRRAAPRRAPAAPPQASSTNLQEQGVDEADYVKTDGRFLYAIENANNTAAIRIYDTQQKGKRVKQVSAIGFGRGMRLTGIYLLEKQQQLIVIGSSYQHRIRSKQGMSGTSIVIVDISNKAKPRTLRHTQLEGTPKTTRRIGNKLYLVLNSYSFPFPSPYKSISSDKPLSPARLKKEKEGLASSIKAWTVADKVPHYRTVGKPGVHSLIESGDFFVNPNDVTNWGFTTILTIDLTADEFKFKSMGWFGAQWGSVIYASQRALYITSSYYGGHNETLNKARFPADLGNRLIHKFAFDNDGFDYRGSGAVLGDFNWSGLSSFQLDEDKNGVLRVVTANSRRTRKSNDPAAHSPVVLTTLAEHPRNKQLITLSRLPNKNSPKALGKPGERLYASRMFEDYAYFVTFKRTDPLYVVDLRNPRRLRVTGELVIPGFSDYLHPLGEGLLLGVGKEATDNGGRWAQLEGLKLSLYDIRNPSKPAEIHKITIGKRGTDSPANRDHHAFTSLAMRGTNTTRVALPVSLVESEENYSRKDGLHRFEVDRKQRRIKHLGAMKPPSNKSGWSWYSNDRSIIIGDKLYYYHNGHFWQGDWK